MVEIPLISCFPHLPTTDRALGTDRMCWKTVSPKGLSLPLLLISTLVTFLTDKDEYRIFECMVRNLYTFEIEGRATRVTTFLGIHF